VKYLREVTPYLRKQNILADILWDDDPYATQHAVRDKRGSDIKIIPLKLCYIVRGSLHQCDKEQTMIEMVSPNGRHTGERSRDVSIAVTIRCGNASEADVWFQSMHSCVESLLTQANAELNLMLGGNPEVRLMGWMSERSTTLDGADCWRPVFVALTSTDLLFYEYVPALKVPAHTRAHYLLCHAERLGRPGADASTHRHALGDDDGAQQPRHPGTHRRHHAHGQDRRQGRHRDARLPDGDASVGFNTQPPACKCRRSTTEPRLRTLAETWRIG